MNRGDCNYLVDEDIVGYNCTWWYEGKRYQKQMRWATLELNRRKDAKFYVQNLTRPKSINSNLTRSEIFNSKSDET